MADVVAARLGVLEAILAELVRNSQNAANPNRKQALVALRRKLSAAMAELHDMVIAGDSNLTRPPLAEEFRTRFSRMRSAVALHQASWSVVLIDDGEAGYQRSATAASEAIRDFIAWMRSVRA